ncbi:unnamed protein product, partial [Mesorhabditis spiculigera]
MDVDDTGDTVDTVVAQFENLDSRVGQTIAKRKWSTGATNADASASKQMKAAGDYCGMDSDTPPESQDAVCQQQQQQQPGAGDAEETAVALNWIAGFGQMSMAQQSTALRNLLYRLPDHHLRTLRHLIEPMFQKDFLGILPDELALLIISYFEPKDMIACAGVSHTWRRLCEEERIWKAKCLAAGYTTTNIKKDRPSFRFCGGWAEFPANKQTGITVHGHMSTDECYANKQARETPYGKCSERSPYKALYIRKRRIVANWRSQKIQSSVVLKGHDEHVITCLQIHAGRIVTGSDDNTLRVWDVERARLLFTLTGHLGGVWTSQVSDDGKYIVSGSTDRTVRVWNGKDGKQLHILQGHTSTVRCMSLNGKILVSGSRDQNLRVWDIETGQCLNVLTGHLAAVRCVQFDGKRVISGAYDFTVKVWNVETGVCIHTLTGHTNRVYSLLFEPERDLVVSGSLDTTIRVWDIVRGISIAVLVGHQSLTSGMQLKGDILVSCNADSEVRVWDIRDGGKCLHRLQGPYGHTSAITSLHLLESGLLATSSDDGTVKLWDVENGQFVRDLVRLQSGGSGGCIWRLKATETLLVCAVGSRNGTEDTKLILLDFDSAYP